MEGKEKRARKQKTIIRKISRNEQWREGEEIRKGKEGSKERSNKNIRKGAGRLNKEYKKRNKGKR